MDQSRRVWIGKNLICPETKLDECGGEPRTHVEVCGEEWMRLLSFVGGHVWMNMEVNKDFGQEWIVMDVGFGRNKDVFGCRT